MVCRAPPSVVAPTITRSREGQAMAYKGLDSLVKDRLRRWPQSPPGLQPLKRGSHAWLRGRPVADLSACHPFLKLPGSDRLRTLPDGLWLNFAGTPVEPYVDIFGIM
jgi:hypothetical protein